MSQASSRLMVGWLVEFVLVKPVGEASSGSSVMKEGLRRGNGREWSWCVTRSEGRVVNDGGGRGLASGSEKVGHGERVGRSCARAGAVRGRQSCRGVSGRQRYFRMKNRDNPSYSECFRAGARLFSSLRHGTLAAKF